MRPERGDSGSAGFAEPGADAYVRVHTHSTPAFVAGRIAGVEMIRFFFRFVGYWLLAATIVLIVRDGAKTIAASALEFTALGEVWFRLAPTTLNQVQFTIEQHLGWPWLWDGLTQWVLTAPAWLVVGILAVLFLLIGRKRRRAVFYDDEV